MQLDLLSSELALLDAMIGAMGGQQLPPKFRHAELIQARPPKLTVAFSQPSYI